MNDSTPPKPKSRWHHFRLLCLLLIVSPLSWYGVTLLQEREQARDEERFAYFRQLQHTALAEKAVVGLLFEDYFEDLPKETALLTDWTGESTALLYSDSPPPSGDYYVLKSFSHPSADLTALKSHLQSKLDERTGHSHDDSFPLVSIVDNTLTFRWSLKEDASTQP